MNGVLYVPMKNGCAVRDRNLASINNLLKVVILNERGTRAQIKQDAGVITKRYDNVHIFRCRRLQDFVGTRMGGQIWLHIRTSQK